MLGEGIARHFGQKPCSRGRARQGELEVREFGRSLATPITSKKVHLKTHLSTQRKRQQQLDADRQHQTARHPCRESPLRIPQPSPQERTHPRTCRSRWYVAECHIVIERRQERSRSVAEALHAQLGIADVDQRDVAELIVPSTARLRLGRRQAKVDRASDILPTRKVSCQGSEEARKRTALS